MHQKYGEKKGDAVYYSWLNKHKLDDSKPMPNHLDSEADAWDSEGNYRADDLGRDVKQSPGDLKEPKNVGQKDGDIAPLEAAEVPIHDGMNRSEASLGEPNEDEDEHIKDMKYERVTEIQPVQQGIKKPEDSIGGGGVSPDQHDNIEKAVGNKEKEVLNHEDSLKYAYPPPAKGETLAHAASRAYMAKELTTKQRNKLDDSDFAYPEENKLPIHDAAHVRNALARFNQTDLPAGKKAEVLGRICRAAKKFGIDSPLCESKGKAEAAGANGPNIHFPSFKFRYTAEPKFGSDQGELIIKAIVLEQGLNVNRWRVDDSEFDNVAAQYKAGRQLRLDHSRDVQKVFGKSFDSKVILGKDIEGYMGQKIDGINPEGRYVAAEFIANPTDPQVRMNILKGYVDTGSIGLDANAFCDFCTKPVQVQDDGSVIRSCIHQDSGVVLRNVDVKEYSYVAEPAFPHSHAFPSFAAAVSETLESSLKHSASKSAPMSAKVPMEAKAHADADNTIDDAKMYSQAEADAYAKMKLDMYKQGMADAMGKFHAAKDGDGDDGKDDGDGKDEADSHAKADAEGKADADARAAGGFKDQPDGGPGKGFAPMTASRKTDQIGRTNSRAEMKAAKDDLISRVLRPTAYAVNADPAMKEIFTAAANAPGAPLSVKNVVKEAFK